jgi:23S rRNA pseudouridine2605 synthase
VRLTRFLARAGVSSRRGAADLVAAGRVLINGRPPTGPGDPVDPERDVVTLDGRRLALAAGAWIALHKPVGYITSRAKDERYPSVFALLGDAPAALVPVGRLDVMSEGLLLFTTDGELAGRLMHPRHAVPRAYRVLVNGALDATGRAALDRGVALEGEDRPVLPLRWRAGPGVLELELAEGRSRVVRRLCVALGLGVRQLVRLSYGPVSLGTLAPGRARDLEAAERDALYRSAGLEPPRG